MNRSSSKEKSSGALAKIYIQFVSFKTYQNAIEAIETGKTDDGKWHLRKTNDTYEGTKMRYQCLNGCPKENVYANARRT